MATPDESLLVHLRPVKGDPEPWMVKLESDHLVLLGPDESLALVLNREEAARYLRIGFELLHGRTVTFTAGVGLKAYRFYCGRPQLHEFLAWLPQKPLREIEKNVRLSGGAMVVAAIALLILGANVSPAWALVLFAVGVLGIYRPHRAMYAFNSGVLATIAFIQLLLRPFVGVDVHADAAGPWMATIVGTVFLGWAIQQIAMLSPNQLLRIARTARDRVAEHGEDSPSVLVRWVGRCCLMTSLALGCYGVGLAVTLFRGWVDADGALTDLSVMGVVAALTAFAGSVLLWRTRPAYGEAKVTGQMLIVVWGLFLWGLAFQADITEPLSFFAGVLSQGVYLLERPYVWAPLIATVAGFNVWFSRAVDRELEEQRG